VALINPSLFEGWSTTVEEAKSLGKRIILSNIRVHLEQNPPGGLFFDPNDPNDLSIRLAEAWIWPAGHDSNLMVQAQNHLQARIESFGREYVQIIQEATEPIPSGLLSPRVCAYE
jgi:glycosyltransferase involved in cell wall biosynthesis